MEEKGIMKENKKIELLFVYLCTFEQSDQKFYLPKYPLNKVYHYVTNGREFPRYH